MSKYVNDRSSTLIDHVANIISLLSIDFTIFIILLNIVIYFIFISKIVTYIKIQLINFSMKNQNYRLKSILTFENLENKSILYSSKKLQ